MSVKFICSLTCDGLAGFFLYVCSVMSIDSSNGEGGGSLISLFSTFVNTIFFSSKRLGGGGGGVLGFVGVVGHFIRPALEDFNKGGASTG